MQLQPIGEVARVYGVSTRTLRYYEQQGLISSTRRGENGYRFYTQQDIQRLKQILILRQLRLPLADVKSILQTPGSALAAAALVAHLRTLSTEIETLAAVRDATRALLARLGEGTELSGALTLQDSEALLRLASLPDSIAEKEAKPMTKLPKDTRTPYKEGDVRILYLPPARVAAAHCTGPDAEEKTSEMINKFIAATNLAALKPDLRLYGFNHPNGEKPDASDHGYERWLTVPDGLAIPAPLKENQFAGGLYAARSIPFGAFDEWNKLLAWVQASPDYTANLGPAECMSGLLEEQLNYIHLYMLPPREQLAKMQLDLLYPVKPKE